ncbi:metal-dependent transcriptional regulator [Methanocella sp. CWC-04]|uniref:Metal-dependent transcriptional regulator n=1 Tax=Methanooceanicella nereidis TaxID=2052831 RepID=A0AAP2W6D6_9EURY|nr:metal-dependent transcriptional regulator [Methanocella sp. CWC-04]MCD1294164.1 metal-dependent transcriptional regulator [Methanocella sp. CWC-04]
MKNIDGLELSPKKIEYLKYILRRGETVKTTDISNEFDVDPSTVTKTINELEGTGLIEHVPYRGVRLTSRGIEYAEFLLRRHRLIALMLSNYGLTPKEACEEASKLEGYVSKEVVNKICNSMGHPDEGVCGAIKHDFCCCCPEEN